MAVMNVGPASCQKCRSIHPVTSFIWIKPRIFVDGLGLAASPRDNISTTTAAEFFSIMRKTLIGKVYFVNFVTKNYDKRNFAGFNRASPLCADSFLTN